MLGCILCAACNTTNASLFPPVVERNGVDAHITRVFPIELDDQSKVLNGLVRPLLPRDRLRILE